MIDMSTSHSQYVYTLHLLTYAYIRSYFLTHAYTPICSYPYAPTHMFTPTPTITPTITPTCSHPQSQSRKFGSRTFMSRSANTTRRRKHPGAGGGGGGRYHCNRPRAGLKMAGQGQDINEVWCLFCGGFMGRGGGGGTSVYMMSVYIVCTVQT